MKLKLRDTGVKDTRRWRVTRQKRHSDRRETIATFRSRDKAREFIRKSKQEEARS